MTSLCSHLVLSGPGRHSAAVHPPHFNLGQLLSDWPECRLEVVCPCSDRVVMLPVQLLLRGGDRPFRAVLAALRCSRCGGRPAPVYLVAGLTRRASSGPPPSWSVELLP